MDLDRLSGFTPIVFLVGLGVSAALAYSMPYGPIIYFIYGMFYDSHDHISGGMLLSPTIGLFGLFILWKSSQIDAVEETSNPFEIIAAVSLAFLAAILMMLLTINLTFEFVTDHSADRSIIGALFAFLLGVVVFVLSAPFFVGFYLYPIVCVGLAIGGLLCVPRLFLYHTTSHPLRQAWEKGKDGTHISSADVESALGIAAKNYPQAQKYQHDLTWLDEKTKTYEATVVEDREARRSAILNDAERFEKEKRVSRRMLETQAAEIEKEVLRKYQENERRR